MGRGHADVLIKNLGPKDSIWKIRRDLAGTVFESSESCHHTILHWHMNNAQQHNFLYLNCCIYLGTYSAQLYMLHGTQRPYKINSVMKTHISLHVHVPCRPNENHVDILLESTMSRWWPLCCIYWLSHVINDSIVSFVLMIMMSTTMTIMPIMITTMILDMMNSSSQNNAWVAMLLLMIPQTHLTSDNCNRVINTHDCYDNEHNGNDNDAFNYCSIRAAGVGDCIIAEAKHEAFHDCKSTKIVLLHWGNVVVLQ